MNSNISRFKEQVSANLVTSWENHPLVASNPYLDAIFSDIALKFLDGGKRTRAVLSALGWTTVSEAPYPTALLHLGTALELFQASALIHDDIIDNAETRRNLRSAHLLFSDHHQKLNWSHQAQHYGTSAAILLGDLWLSMADEQLRLSTDSLPNANEIWNTWNQMTAEVAIGQYLDLQLECAPSGANLKAHIQAVITHKSANYSVIYPLLLGALLAGADNHTQKMLMQLGALWGTAFQLRDDELGTFGDPSQTGKPAGGDLLEGKKTLLYAIALETLSNPQLEFFNQVFGNPNASAEQINKATEMLQTTGVAEEHRRVIKSLMDEAASALEEWQLPSTAKQNLATFAAHLVERNY